MPNVRQAMFPYGMSKQADGKWTFFNRKYKQVGVVSEDWADYDDARYKIAAKFTPAKLKKLDVDGTGEGDIIYFYNDATNPENGGEGLRAYLDKVSILLTL